MRVRVFNGMRKKRGNFNEAKLVVFESDSFRGELGGDGVRDMIRIMIETMARAMVNISVGVLIMTSISVGALPINSEFAER